MRKVYRLPITCVHTHIRNKQNGYKTHMYRNHSFIHTGLDNLQSTHTHVPLTVYVQSESYINIIIIHNSF